jgi:hypothetical protein
VNLTHLEASPTEHLADEQRIVDATSQRCNACGWVIFVLSYTESNLCCHVLATSYNNVARLLFFLVLVEQASLECTTPTGQLCKSTTISAARWLCWRMHLSVGYSNAIE